MGAQSGTTNVGLGPGAYAVTTLMRAMGVTSFTELARAIGVSRDVVRVRRSRGLTVDEARTWARIIGLDAARVWPSYPRKDPGHP